MPEFDSILAPAIEIGSTGSAALSYCYVTGLPNS